MKRLTPDPKDLQHKSDAKEYNRKPLPPKLRPVKKFDPLVLPDSLRPFVRDVSERLSCPVEFVAMAVITIAASMLGRSVAVAPKKFDNWIEYLGFWAAAVGDPATMKSPATQATLGPVRKIEAKALLEYANRLEVYNQEHLKWEIRQKVAKAKYEKALNSGKDVGDGPAFEPEPTKPPFVQYLVMDATIEALQVVFKDNPRGLLMYRDELAGWIAGFNKPGHEGERALYLGLVSGKDPVTINRIQRGTIHIPPALISILGTIQPGKIKGLSEDGYTGKDNDGFLQRFSFMVWPDAAGDFKMVDKEPDRDASDLYDATQVRLSEFEFREGDPKVFRLSQGARELWAPFYEGEMNDLRGQGGGEMLGAHLTKLAGKVAPLALVFELCDNPEAEEVGRDAMDRAIRLAEILKTHAERLYSPQVQPEVLAAHRLAEKLDRLPGSFTASEVYKKNWTGLTSKDKEDVSGGLDLLVELDWLRSESIKHEGGGRPTTTYFQLPPEGASTIET